MAHWHDHNPWANEIVYLPDIEELSHCLDPHRPLRLINTIASYGKRFDAYILPSPTGYHSCGIRFGAEGHEYLSPPIDRFIADLLLSKYGNGHVSKSSS